MKIFHFALLMLLFCGVPWMETVTIELFPNHTYHLDDKFMQIVSGLNITFANPETMRTTKLATTTTTSTTRPTTTTVSTTTTGMASMTPPRQKFIFKPLRSVRHRHR